MSFFGSAKSFGQHIFQIATLRFAKRVYASLVLEHVYLTNIFLTIGFKPFSTQ